MENLVRPIVMFCEELNPVKLELDLMKLFTKGFWGCVGKFERYEPLLSHFQKTETQY